MDLEKMKELIKQTAKEHKRFVKRALLCERYYRAHNDILFRPRPGDDPENPRNSAHRIPSRFYPIIVNQKASYMFDKPPRFELGSEKLNADVSRVLGSEFAKTCKQLSINASNCGEAWLHYWVTGENADGEEEKGDFRYGVVDPKEIIAIWGDTLDRKLIGLARHYMHTDPEGQTWEYYDYWDDEFCYSFRTKQGKTYRVLEPAFRWFYYSTDSGEPKETNVYRHGMGRIPFIRFKCNYDSRNELEGLKERIDAYDESVSGFADDLEDIQQIIFILSGYGAEPPEDFLERLKTHKLVKLESGYNPEGIKPELDTLDVEIPYDARKLSMDENRKSIFEQASAVDQTPEVLNYTSGEALKYRYALLELKASMTEDEFRSGFSILVKEICKFLGQEIKDENIEQRWTRNKVNNDTELVNNARLCLGFTSLRSALKANPYVEDVDEEMEQIKQERLDDLQFYEEQEARMNAATFDERNVQKRQPSPQEERNRERESEQKKAEGQKYNQQNTRQGQKKYWGRNAKNTTTTTTRVTNGSNTK